MIGRLCIILLAVSFVAMGLAYADDLYLNTGASSSVERGGSAAFMPVAVEGDHRGQNVELFYTREVTAEEYHWNWVATGRNSGAGLAPGHYRVNFVEFGNQTSYAINEGGGEIGSFDVAPGEIVYLGHVTFVPAGRLLHVRVEDRFEEARARLPDGLRDRLIKRLVTFPAWYEFQNQETYRVGPVR